MFTKLRLRRQIRRWLRSHSFLWINYRKWYVGITNNPQRREHEHRAKKRRQPRHFKYWNARTVLKARDLEKYFGSFGKGMKGGKVLGNVRKNSFWIYVYRT